MKNTFLFILCLSFCFSACQKDDFASIDEELILDYIAENNLDAEVTEDGLYYVIEEAGTSERPTQSSTVAVHYEGFTLDGNKFDSSYDAGVPFISPLTGVITGWRLGIPLFGKGGKGILLIPSRYAYGENSPSSAIPANSVLIFNIELLDFQ